MNDFTMCQLRVQAGVAKNFAYHIYLCISQTNKYTLLLLRILCYIIRPVFMLNSKFSTKFFYSFEYS